MSDASKTRGFAGLRVLALESRRAEEMSKLIANYGGQPTIAPSMREVPIESNAEAQEFAGELAAGGFDVVIFLTGVGARALVRVVEKVYPLDQFVAALKKIAVVVRGPKAAAILKEWGVPIAISAPEPNTWREILLALDEKSASVPLQGRRVAVQEYGAVNPALIEGLSQRGAQVASVPVYEWSLPEDLEPLRRAVKAIADQQIDVVLFTSAMQMNHLFQIAGEINLEDAMRRALKRVLIASIGPVTSERLREHGLEVDLEPSHPKMGFLVSETAARASELLVLKRSAK